ncbi:hypothetical protein A3F66_06585 [candidate division TM6 bacterium RIFCSPHIGHO2_12_FULL_32_22]|nr:MAG: hypothetical protein A3F66_06585 [candidate division TM6 bacterium RIFCSPHIGHO2_12_FULL_32_22]
MVFHNRFSKILFLSPFIYLLVVLFANQLDSVKNLAEEVVDIESVWGNQRVSSDIEKKIYEIANKMGIGKSFEIRKMNVAVMQRFGYCNALAVAPVLANIIPISSDYLYVSNGFMEDLSEDEQIFLIGHELTHIKYSHSFYLFIFNMMLISMIIFLSYLAYQLLAKKLSGIFLYMAFFLAVGSLISVADIISSLYSRYIERVADCESMQILNAYDGALKLIERWKNEYKMAEHNNYAGLFADHPSNHERRIYCLDLKNKHSQGGNCEKR